MFLPTAVLFLVLPAAAQTAASASTTTLALVEYALRTDLPDMDPKLANYFLQVDTDTLPPKKRDKALARQLAIQVALKMQEGKKKGGMRFVAGQTCEPKHYPLQVILLIPKLVEISEEEIEYVEERTKCDEDDLSCQFSLMVAIIPRPAPKPPKKRFFLFIQDPLNGIVAESHAKSSSGNSSFFGSGILSCER
jgi:hypothetical protein